MARYKVVHGSILTPEKSYVLDDEIELGDNEAAKHVGFIELAPAPKPVKGEKKTEGEK